MLRARPKPSRSSRRLPPSNCSTGLALPARSHAHAQRAATVQRDLAGEGLRRGDAGSRCRCGIVQVTRWPLDDDRLAEAAGRKVHQHAAVTGLLARRALPPLPVASTSFCARTAPVVMVLPSLRRYCLARWCPMAGRLGLSQPQVCLGAECIAPFTTKRIGLYVASQCDDLGTVGERDGAVHIAARDGAEIASAQSRRCC